MNVQQVWLPFIADVMRRLNVERHETYSFGAFTMKSMPFTGFVQYFV